jgi:hypothetical protein
MPVLQSPIGGFAGQFFDNNGVILTGGKIYTYAAGTTTPQAVYTSVSGATPHANPIVLDSAGRVPGGEIWLTSGVSYKFVIETSTSILIGSYDNITGINAAITAINAEMVTYDPPFVGGVATTAEDKFAQSVSVSDFGAVGNGVTDDTVALTNFFNNANANPGVRHFMNDAIYLVTDTLPDITVSNVWIEGVGAEIHDTGELISGTVIKWGGASGTSGPLVRISAVSGAGNQRISSVNFTGIGIDCNEGDIDYGMEILSARFCNIDVAIVNAGNTGLNLGVVATLGESKDLQRCNISLKTRQIEAPNGFGVVLAGDASANVSMNTFWVDAQISNIQSIYCVNSDNNIWDYVRIYKIPSGTATEGVSLLGGATFNDLARAEKFNFYTGNVDIHVYGTTGSPSFAFPSVGNSVFLDKENGTPNPTIETSGEIGVIYNTTQLPENAWVEYVPTVTPSGGAITSYNATGRYAKRGNLVTISINVVITNNGTGVGTLDVTLPFPCEGSALGGTCLNGRERAITGVGVTAYIEGGSNLAIVTTATSTYPGGNGHVITFSGSYEVA